MQNLPVQFNQGGQLPQISAELAGQLKAFHDQAFADLGGQTLRRIKVGAAGFQLIDGGSTTDVPFHQLVGVLVGLAECNHAVWYAREYKPGMEPEQPDLVWKMPTMDTFPNALPQQFRKKINRNGREAWAFSICRRAAFALLRTDSNGQMYLELEKPYVMDLTSMSLWGKGVPAQNQYKLSGLQDVCRKYSGNGITVTPMMFYTQILPDSTAPRGVVNFRPQVDAQGNLVFLTGAEIQAIYACATDESTRSMLEIRERLDYDGGNTATQTAPVIPQSAPIATSQPAPVQAGPVGYVPNVGTSAVSPEQKNTVTITSQSTGQSVTTPVNDLLAQAQAIVGQGAPKAEPQTNDGMLSAANAILNGTGAAPVAAPAAEAPKPGIANSVTNMLSNLME